MSINGKVALVTGAGQGIGRAIALRLANDGADIAIADLNDEKMRKVADEVKAVGRKATVVRADVSKRDDVYAAVAHTENELGGFDIIVNNAGIAQIQPLADVTPEEFDKIIRVNVAGVLWGIQAAGEEVQGARAEGQDHQRVVDRGTRGLPYAGRLLGDQVCRPRLDAGSGERVCERRHHGQRILSRHSRHRHVGRDRQADGRDHGSRNRGELREVRWWHCSRSGADAGGCGGFRFLFGRSRF
jgi:NAD(P)-dependent dehydrogenase (short-subunit alcohol dehydrogenase family)